MRPTVRPMEFAHAVARFTFLAHALNRTGGFAPQVQWRIDPDTKKNVALLLGDSYLARYPRESEEKYGGRNAVAVYENHLASACGRFVGFLGRRQPQRKGADGPLTKLLVEDADLRGNDLDSFWRAFALEAKARGSMLLVIDKARPGVTVSTLADQVRLRDVPYLRGAAPESLVRYSIDKTTGLFATATLRDVATVDGEDVEVIREYDAAGWRVKYGEKIVDQGAHAFGVCPVLPFTENGQQFPVVGKYAQVADLSLDLFNLRSELRELQRGSTFALLTLQVPPEQAQAFNAAKVAATVGAHSMLVHGGATPEFVSPDSGPAEVYMKDLDRVQAAISRITCEDILTGSKAQGVESGVSRKLRFEGLNSDLATFAKQLQTLERIVWKLFHRAIGQADSRVEIAWPTDYNLADVLGELDTLALMQDTGFPPVVLAEKRHGIVAIEFDGADDETKARLRAAIDEAAQRDAKAAAEAPDPEGEDDEGAPGAKKPAAAAA